MIMTDRFSEKLKRYIKHFCFSEKFEPPLRNHLKKVYTTLTFAVLSSITGYCSSIYLYTKLNNILFKFSLVMMFLGIIIETLTLAIIPYDYTKLQLKRLLLVGCISFSMGYLLETLFYEVIILEPAIFMQAFLLTILVFSCFSLSALVAPKNYYLYLSGISLSITFGFVIIVIGYLFLNLELFVKLHLYVELLFLCVFILYET